MKTLISTLALTLALASFAHAGEPDADDEATPPAHSTAAPAAPAAPSRAAAQTAAPGAPAAMSQRDRMRKCNADAHGLKGGDRRAFMSRCLSKKHTG
jgi:hypothetical protein